MIQSYDDLKKIEIEIIGKENPVTINMGGIDNIIALELEQFHYAAPDGGQTYINPFLAIAIPGTKGRYGPNGQQSETLKTVPWDYKANAYRFNIEHSDLTKWVGSGNVININFVIKDPEYLNQKVTFINNYLLNLSVYSKK